MIAGAEQMQDHLTYLYGADVARAAWPRLAAKLEEFAMRNSAQIRSKPSQPRLTEDDVILITYGDQIQESDRPPLQVLDEVLTRRCADFLSCLHILPFFPYSSDDGFSVIDYKEVNPAWGDWQDIARLSSHFRLMFDAVINHISRQSAWFQAFVRGEEPYLGYFVTVDPGTDLSQVVRPRTLPLLTPVQTAHGLQHVWTTFSADQIDLNYASVDLLLEIVDVLLFYVERGADLIRLDAIGFMWKEPGTTCIHLPQTHHIIQLMRAALDAVAPQVILVTETNVPHDENISYFGDGSNEAQMVYNFTLPPLTLHAFHTGDASHLSRWASGLTTPSQRCTFFNFMASHDGIGLRPLEGIFPPAEVDRLAQRIEEHGGLVSYKANPDGSQSPYELNIVYFDALNNPNADEDRSRQVARFLASQAILLSLQGVPGIYVHSLFGSRNWREGVVQSGQNRTINRRKFRRDDLEAQLDDPSSLPNQVFSGLRRLIQARTEEPAFHPNAQQRIVQAHPSLFCFVREAQEAAYQVLCVHNVCGELITCEFDLVAQGLPRHGTAVALLGTQSHALRDGTLTLTLPPYGVLWLRFFGFPDDY